ncbi:thiamine phosphate synthase [Xanthobacter autotrophicus]|uniref:thiamine phosphate synthase n=1 Tax=Xanthobacter autotrophicus TaxID=280 RepID=UPI00372CADDE
MVTDYRDYYDIEHRLFPRIHDAFKTGDNIDPIDFYTILVWKASRAKTYHRDRIERISEAKSIYMSVDKIINQLRLARDDKSRLSILMDNWKFYLPTATAILSVFYPDDFTIYDRRVCREVGLSYDLDKKCGLKKELWSSYQAFIIKVMAAVPDAVSLRDADRVLWGRSALKDHMADLALPDPRIMLITNRKEIIEEQLSRVVCKAYDAGCRWISLREKDLPEARQRDLFVDLRAALPKNRDLLLSIHGSAQLAKDVGADGVHLPDGSDVSEARQILGDGVLIGLSVHSEAQAQDIDDNIVDYITVSPVFKTESKPDTRDPFGPKGLLQFVAASPVPVIGLAGIAPANVAACRDAGAAGLAVMGSVMRADDPAAEFSALLAAWGGKASKSEPDPDTPLRARAKS